MNRTEVLELVGSIVNGEREEQYGTPEDSFKTIAQLWSTYMTAALGQANIRIRISSPDVAAMMALMKIARAGRGGNLDSWIDLAGYGVCGAEIMSKAAEEAKAKEEIKVRADD